MSNKYGNLNIETKLYATHYNQKKGSSSAAEEVQKSVNRVLPQLKIDLQTVLATNKTLFDGYTQTLEPRAQYLYRPYKDQSNIGSKLVMTILALVMTPLSSARLLFIIPRSSL